MTVTLYNEVNGPNFKMIYSDTFTVTSNDYIAWMPLQKHRRYVIREGCKPVLYWLNYWHTSCYKYINGSCVIDHISYSLVNPVNRQMQNDG